MCGTRPLLDTSLGGAEFDGEGHPGKAQESMESLLVTGFMST